MDHRLKKNSDFNRVFRKGKRGFSRIMTVVYMSGQPTIKCGLAVTKKHGNAVCRNRIKRVLRAAFRAVLPDLQGGLYLVICPKAGTSFGFFEAVSDLRYICKKQNLLRRETKEGGEEGGKNAPFLKEKKEPFGTETVGEKEPKKCAAEQGAEKSEGAE